MGFVSKLPSYRLLLAGLLLVVVLLAVAGCSGGSPAAATPTRPAGQLSVTVQAPAQAPAGGQGTPEAPGAQAGTAYPEPTALQPYPAQTP